jgi:hypothetical protein
MAETDPMNINERRKYLHKVYRRYLAAKTKSERSRLLDEAQAITSLQRKSLIRRNYSALSLRAVRWRSDPPFIRPA